jgi:hypothetical protein
VSTNSNYKNQKSNPNNFFFCFSLIAINKTINVSDAKHHALPGGAQALARGTQTASAAFSRETLAG